jgi:hypothetical protein
VKPLHEVNRQSTIHLEVEADRKPSANASCALSPRYSPCSLSGRCRPRTVSRETCPGAAKALGSSMQGPMVAHAAPAAAVGAWQHLRRATDGARTLQPDSFPHSPPPGWSSVAYPEVERPAGCVGQEYSKGPQNPGRGDLMESRGFPPRGR